MIFPLVLILVATASAAAVAYGVHPNLARYGNGLTVIMVSRRLMWPMIALSLLCCISLLGLVISGRRRAWWLLGLAPVLALFVIRFAPGTPGPSAVLEAPILVDANSPAAPEAGDYIVGIMFGDHPYAFPYRELFVTPVVCITDYDQRILLMWSAYANRALAIQVGRDMKARDLELVSSPANSLLLYDRRLGQFLSGVTGQQINGRDVAGFGKALPTEKMPWSAWRAAHPDTKVMSQHGHTDAPNRPILPQYHLRIPPSPDPMMVVTVLATTQPAAIPEDAPLRAPLNVTVGGTRVLVVRDQAGRLRAFDRHVKEDLFLTFEPKQVRKHPEAVMLDNDTQSAWTIDGRAVDGPLKGQRLRAIDLDQRLYWGVMKYWYPKLQLVEP
jgi:hypothetical protein